ncbi:MAG: response regulator, partial [Deltaproteobacteria bacterium]|nr:response regulator [Deltaproteobacteria bacterium]
MKKAEEYRPDLILMDIMLGGEIDGIEVAKQTQSSLEIPIVFATGYDDQTILDRAKLLNPAGYILKPYNARQIGVTIEMALYVAKVEKKRRRAEKSLIESENLYRSLFKGMLNCFAYCQMLFEDGRPQDFIYLAVNDAFGLQTGLKDVVGRKATEVIPGIREADPQLF